MTLKYASQNLGHATRAPQGRGDFGALTLLHLKKIIKQFHGQQGDAGPHKNQITASCVVLLSTIFVLNVSPCARACVQLTNYFGFANLSLEKTNSIEFLHIVPV